jgi:hypothetical protein
MPDCGRSALIDDRRRILGGGGCDSTPNPLGLSHRCTTGQASNHIRLVQRQKGSLQLYRKNGRWVTTPSATYIRAEENMQAGVNNSFAAMTRGGEFFDRHCCTVIHMGSPTGNICLVCVHLCCGLCSCAFDVVFFCFILESHKGTTSHSLVNLRHQTPRYALPR